MSAAKQRTQELSALLEKWRRDAYKMGRLARSEPQHAYFYLAKGAVYSACINELWDIVEPRPTTRNKETRK